MRSLGILATHPIQYYSPLLLYLAGLPGLDLTVYYCLKPDSKEQGTGFGVEFQWDTDLLTGYRSVWLKNRSDCAGLTGFFGCDTPEIRNIIREKKFDAFLVLGWAKKSMWQAMIECWRTKTRLLVRGDSHLHGETGFFKRAAKDLFYPYFMKRFDACLAVGKWSAEYFEHFGAKRIIPSPHFVENDRFEKISARAREKRAELRRSWGISEQSTVFLFAGKFEEKKRPMDVLIALKYLMQKGISKESARVLMVGDGVLKQACEIFVKENELPVTFAGFSNQTRMPDAYAASDILILPSDGRETWGLVVNEAMACGLPVILSDKVGCGPDLVIEGETGFIFPCGDARFLSDEMAEFIQEENRAKLGENARKHIAKYSVAAAAQGALQAFEAGKS